MMPAVGSKGPTSGGRMSLDFTQAKALSNDSHKPILLDLYNPI